MTGLIEYSEMEKFSIGELRKQIRIKAKQELAFKDSTLGRFLRHAEDESRRQVI